jgi:hypothetical protein
MELFWKEFLRPFLRDLRTLRNVAEPNAVAGVMDVSQLPQPVVHEIAFSILQGNHPQTPGHTFRASPTIGADMVLVDLDLLSDPETGHAEPGVLAAFFQFLYVHKGMHVFHLAPCLPKDYGASNVL